jgi:hypothetical protein
MGKRHGLRHDYELRCMFSKNLYHYMFRKRTAASAVRLTHSRLYPGCAKPPVYAEALLRG